MRQDAPSEVSGIARMGMLGQAAATGALAGTAKPSERLWNRNFSLLWQGQLVSSVGKQAFALTCMLAIKDLTGSGSVMGLLMAFAILPSVLLGPIAGVFVDRLDRRRLIAWTDIAGGLVVLLAFATLLSFRGNAPVIVAALFAVTIATGLLDTFSQPAIGSAIPDLVPASRLEAANGLNLGGIQAAGFIAQSLSGLLYRALGATALTLVNAVTYLYAGITELFISIPKTGREYGSDSVPESGARGVRSVTRRSRNITLVWRTFSADLKEGLRFVVGHPGMLASLVSFAALNFFAAPILVTLPFYATDYLGQGSEWYGFLMAAFGAGAIAGYVLVAARPSQGKGRAATVIGGLVLEACLIALALAPLPSFSFIVIIFTVGFANGVVNVNIATLFQLATPRGLLGRVNGLSQTLSAGAMPLGMALSGVAFDLSGQNVPLMFSVSAVSMLAITLAPIVLSRGYLRFLSTQLVPENAK
ncbi:MAG: MFS transporter [Spirochaetota bacterium]